MNRARQRSTISLLHLLVGVVMATYVYLPLPPRRGLRRSVGIAGVREVPLAVGIGLWLWKGVIRRAVAGWGRSATVSAGRD